MKVGGVWVGTKTELMIIEPVPIQYTLADGADLLLHQDQYVLTFWSDHSISMGDNAAPITERRAVAKMVLNTPALHALAAAIIKSRLMH